MKMVKSLLLGSAAGIIAVAGAQAADLPVKAKPVEYVKVCSLYGAGYYYMPGTDICLKLGGFVRYQLNYNAGNSISGGPQLGSPGGFNTRQSEQEVTQRVRAVITVDTRQQTAYGTLRTYLLLGYNQDTTALGTTSPPVYMNRGFIQIAGFTFGKATSFFDIYPNASFAYNAGNNFSGDSGDGGVILMSYTAQFGNGFSGTLGIEHQRRGTPTVYTLNAVGAPLNPYVLGALPTGVNNLGGVPGSYPDLVGNLRFDQSWGTWIVAGALHDVSASYYGPSANTVNEAFGHPGQEIGWAVTTGFIWNLPFITPGDRFSAQVAYSQGATQYHAATRTGASPMYFTGNTVAYGFWEDAVYSGNSGLNSFELTTVWSINAGFEHLWTPSLKTSWYGSYIDVSHSGAAAIAICNGNATSTSIPMATVALGCNPDWTAWTVGSRTEWEPVKGLTFGVDVIYQQINTATPNAVGSFATAAVANSGKPAGTYFVDDLNVWSGSFRVQRNFLP